MTTSTTTSHDVINDLAGISDDSPTAILRGQKPDLVAFAQGSDHALLDPADPGGLPLLERHAIAYRVGLLTGFAAVAGRHRDRLRALGVSDDFIMAIDDFPRDSGLDPRLRALLDHTDRVTLAPGTAEASHIAALHAAGLSPGEVVTVGQLLGFLAYQVRAIAVARAFAANHVAGDPS